MTARELVVLGTASQVPTRTRNHNGYFLRWDDAGVLFDPGEGSQRQMLRAGLPSSAVTRVCITHFHGDHCLGLPGVLQRRSLDRVTRPLPVTFPASGEVFAERLRRASIFNDRLDVRMQPVALQPHAGELVTVEHAGHWRLRAGRLLHPVDTIGWRMEEHAGRTMLRERLAAAGVRGSDVGRLQREGAITLEGRRVALEDVSVERPGQVFAFVMDTSWCDGALALAEGADLLVCEATFASDESQLAAAYGHLTAAQAGRLADQAGARCLVITHFSQRYPDVSRLAEEAAASFSGEIVAAADFDRVPVPRRKAP